MDEGGKPPHAFGGGQQRSHHPRPFFYVQPPSQPYYLYQHWQLNNPYGHFGVPAGFNYTRPCVHPYQYMQYPGFVFPHAPLYPLDYRRMFEPRSHAPAWSEAPRQPPPPPPPGRPETASSEAQTDPSDAITKLIECLDKIRAGELQGAGRELDSGVASQSSGMFSPGEEKGAAHLPPPVAPDGGGGSPAVVFSDSTMAVYDGESSQRSLDGLSPSACWSGGLEEELPLDSSSVHEECPDFEEAGPPLAPPPTQEHCLQREGAQVADIQSDVSATDQCVPKGDAEELLKQPDPSVASQSQAPAGQPALKDAISSVHVSQERQPAAFSKADASYQILKLPFESVFTSGAAAAGRLPSPSAAYYYNYLSMQTTHERMSVLSPSLDELSSRDEMFSTDLEDVDLFPKRVTTGATTSTRPAGEQASGEAWSPGSKRFLCACCGKSLARAGGRSKAHNPKPYREPAADSEEESRYARGCEPPVRVVVRKHSAPRKTHAAAPRHAAKPWHKRGQCKDPPDPVGQEEGHDLRPLDSAEGEAGEATAGELQCRTCQDRLHADHLSTSDHGRWGEADPIPRRRQAPPLQRQEMSAQRKVVYRRPRDEDNDDDEDDEEDDDMEPPLPPLHWERGSTARGEPRC